MKVIAIKCVTSTTFVLATFFTLGSFLMLTLLKSDQSKLDSSSQAKLILQNHRSTESDINNFDKHALNSLPAMEVLAPILGKGVGLGSKRTIMTNPSHACASGTDGPLLVSPVCDAQSEDSVLVILVTSAPENFQQRKAIRNTWGRRRHVSEALNEKLKGTSQPWRTIFMIGSTSNMSLQVQIQEEARKEGDILLGDFIDSYRNLTVKVQQGLCWALRNCNANYVLKTDDDCFVNTELFSQFLEKHNKHSTKLYAGFSMKSLDVIRNPLNKWHVSRSSYPGRSYPPYASGTGYVVSRDVLQAMVQAAPDVQYFPMEDAYTGVLASTIGVRLRDTSRFVLNNVNWGVCNYLYLLVIHQVTPEQQYLGLMYSEDALDPEKCQQMDEYIDWN